MANTTRWKDIKINNLDEITKILSSDISNTNTELSKSIYSNVSIIKHFEHNNYFEINSKKYQFNYISFSYDKYINDNDITIVTEKAINNEGFLIIYSDGIDTSFIINKHTGALTVLRLLLGYTGKNEIMSDKVEISSDMIIFLISKLYNNEFSYSFMDHDGHVTNLSIDSIIGFRGHTNDTLSTVSAKGDSLMNILSTLSFVLESKLLNQIKLRLTVDDHENIELKISTNGTIDTDIKTYSGPFKADDQTIRSCKLYIYLYTEILPILKQWYYEEVDSNDWSPEKYIDFLKLVAEDLKGKVDLKLTELS